MTSVWVINKADFFSQQCALNWGVVGRVLQGLMEKLFLPLEMRLPGLRK